MEKRGLSLHVLKAGMKMHVLLARAASFVSFFTPVIIEIQLQPKLRMSFFLQSRSVPACAGRFKHHCLLSFAHAASFFNADAKNSKKQELQKQDLSLLYLME